VQTLSYSLCSQLAQLLSLFLLFRAIFLVGLVKVYAWCMKNSRRKRKCCTTYAPVRSFVSHIYVWTSLCLHKCEQINFIAYFLAPHDGAANGLASAIYMVSYAILILKSLLFFFAPQPLVLFLRFFLLSPFNQPTNEMKTRAKVFLPHLFLLVFFLCLLFALWQSSQNFCLASAISWRQLWLPFNLCFRLDFSALFDFSSIGERQKTAIKESFSMHFPCRSTLN